MTTIFEISDTLVLADSKALATYGPLGINVVPVSTLYMTPAGEIVLVNYFLKKTLQNILEHPEVALTCWSGMAGYQIKGTVVYITDGVLFEDIKNRVYQTLPERVVKGILVLTPREIHDISPRA
jgi:predicted pyridoxine 5'-phosphate oxidase superfamily flavin-nucleotide-binding protein